MDKPKQLNITRGLMLGFCVLIPIFLLFGLFSLYDIHKVSSLSRTIYDHPLVVSNATLQSNVSIIKMHRNMKDVVLLEDPKRIQLSIDSVNQEEKQVYHFLDIVKNKILGDEGKRLESEARTLFNDWRPIREEVISFVRMGERNKAAGITVGKGSDHVAKLEEKMLGLTNYARTKASSFMIETEKTLSRLNATTIIFLILAIIVSSMIAFFTLNRTASAENELKESVEKYRHLVESTSDWVWACDIDGRQTFANETVKGVLGYEVHEIIGVLAESLMHPEDAKRLQRWFNKSVKEKKVGKTLFFVGNIRMEV